MQSVRQSNPSPLLRIQTPFLIILTAAAVLAIIRLRADPTPPHHLTTDPAFLAALALLGLSLLALLLLLTSRARIHRACLEQSANLVTLLDHHGVLRYVSAAHERILGYRPSDIERKPAIFLIHPTDLEALQGTLDRFLQASEPFDIELRVRHNDGSYRWLACTAINRLHDPLVRRVIVTSRDITVRKHTQATLEYQSCHDPLTNLPNRTCLIDRLHQAITTPVPATTAALLLLDLDHFKDINDTLGHQAGDVLLQLAGARLANSIRSTDTIARLGGDEYAVLLPTADASIALHLADRISHAFDQPFNIDNHTLQASVSIGIALYPDHGEDPHALLRHADVAMYQAKHDHLRITLYEPQHDRYTLQRLALIGDLRQALDRDLRQLALHYQPKLQLTDNRPCGVEALLRWQHPTQGNIPPDQFIPLAEQTGLIVPLTHWVLETAIKQCRAWQDSGITLAVAVNLSVRVLHDQSLPAHIAHLLKTYNFQPANLTLEITETCLMADPVRAKAVLTQLAALGVQLSIDDFGTGYSSLAYLKELPVHELKIDKSFVLGMGADTTTKDAAIVRSVIGMAHALTLTVVAEGVENADAQTILADLSCDTAQGYHICRPIPAPNLERWLPRAANLPA